MEDYRDCGYRVGTARGRGQARSGGVGRRRRDRADDRSPAPDTSSQASGWSAIANRTLDKAAQAFATPASHDVHVAESVAAVEDLVARGQPAVVDDPRLVCEAANIDVIVEVTGTVEFGAHVAMAAIQHRKHVVLVNAELDSTRRTAPEVPCRSGRRCDHQHRRRRAGRGDDAAALL